VRRDAITGSWRRAQDRLAAGLSPLALLVACAILLLADWATRLAGDSVIPGGPLDETAHALTTLIACSVLSRAARHRFLIPALVASVAIDADHVPGSLGVNWITQGTPRPYPHSLLTPSMILLLAWLWPRRRDVLLGVAIGLAWHFLRDVGENGSGVSLLWPLSDHVFTLPHRLYLGAIGALAVLGGIRYQAEHRGRRAPRPAPAGAR
jgi:membrane-bound metal-dependent hydrolase YbcI (DUF457 family)